MRVINALLLIVISVTLTFALSAGFSSATHPKDLLRSLYNEEGRPSSPNDHMIENNWNFLRPNAVGAVNGGGGCAGCTLIVGLLEQVMQISNNNTAIPINNFCGPMHKVEKDICTDVLKLLLPVVQTYRDEGLTADVACHALKACKTDPGQPTCHLFPTTKQSAASLTNNNNRVREIVASIDGADFRERHLPLFKDIRAFNICTLLPEVCDMEDHLPAFDTDKDTYSYKTSKTLRGTYWRGEDCNDLDATVHPGKDSLDATTDENCNGIFGTDSSGAPFEEKFCQNSEQMGIAVLGDSATAHFSIPPHWLNASDFTYESWKMILRDVENELDWPMLSWSTAHLNNSQFPDYWLQIEPTSSLYKFLKEDNLCNNNDYQNLGVNGARASKLLDFAKILGSKNSATEKARPRMQIMAMIGNDVCNKDTSIESMTTPEEFYQSYLDAVIYTDSILAPGSVQVLVGLADGRVLWEFMSERIHPIGWTNKNVKYVDLYNYLNCLQLSPCAGWMNSNETIRNRTSAHAALLSSQLLKVQSAVEGKLKNSRVVVINNWMGALKNQTVYPDHLLIEKSDGFHPSSAGQSLLAQYYQKVLKGYGVWPKPNPYNDQIRQQFPNI